MELANLASDDAHQRNLAVAWLRSGFPAEFVEELNRLGFTLQVEQGDRPLPHVSFRLVRKRNPGRILAQVDVMANGRVISECRETIARISFQDPEQLFRIMKQHAQEIVPPLRPLIEGGR